MQMESGYRLNKRATSRVPVINIKCTKLSKISPSCKYANWCHEVNEEG